MITIIQCTKDTTSVKPIISPVKHACINLYSIMIEVNTCVHVFTTDIIGYTVVVSLKKGRCGQNIDLI